MSPNNIKKESGLATVATGSIKTRIIESIVICMVEDTGHKAS
ncbi:hypothetical protein BN2364_4186 [Alloalcanivorax xenomutans]|nr:hypothetical protein BN2364_4186 [Alloalcanivorax xenomutans]